MIYIGLDVHRDYCEVAIAEAGQVRSGGRIDTSPLVLESWAREVADEATVALEATANALAIALVIEPHVGQVVLADPKAVRAAARGGAKTDRIDAALLARLAASGFLAEVWAPDEATRAHRRLVSRRMQLMHQRTREKNQIHAVLYRALIGRPPVSDLFGVGGRDRPPRARLLRDAGPAHDSRRQRRHRLLFDGRDRRHRAVPECTAPGGLPGPGSAGRPVGPRARPPWTDLQAGPGYARHVLVEAAWHLGRTIGPLRAFHERVRARRGANVATVAVARKLTVICWHMLTKNEDYAFARHSLTREKLRRLELMTGAERQRGRRLPERVFAPRAQHEAERELAAQAEAAYLRLMSDWQSRPAKVGAGATPGRVKTPTKRRGSAADL